MEWSNTLIGAGLAALLCTGCAAKEKEKTGKPEVNYAEKIKLLEADKAFSDLSEKGGMTKAFIDKMDDNAVLLRPDHLPVVGAYAIDYLIQINDTGFVLKWQPHNAEVSGSGDMGYTYGIYSITPSVADTQLLGTYLNVWKRQDDGTWKFVANSWNEGIGNPQ